MCLPWVFKFKVMHRASWKKETKETCKHFRETQERSHRDVFVWNGNGNEIATFKIHFLQQKKHTINGTNIYMVRISCNYSSDGHFLFAFFSVAVVFVFALIAIAEVTNAASSFKLTAARPL